MNIAIVVAGGKGSRLTSLNYPKQFAVVNGKTIMEYTLSVFNDCPEINRIVLVANPSFIDESTTISNKFSKVTSVIIGGETRQLSVFNALKAIKANDDDIILIHDCARPLINQRIIKENIKECTKYGAVVTAIEKTNYINDGSFIDYYGDDNKPYIIQTPQTFEYKVIKSAHDKAFKDNQLNTSDDTQLIKRIGKEVHVVNGDINNFKITTEEDLKRFIDIVNKKKA